MLETIIYADVCKIAIWLRHLNLISVVRAALGNESERKFRGMKVPPMDFRSRVRKFQLPTAASSLKRIVYQVFKSIFLKPQIIASSNAGASSSKIRLLSGLVWSWRVHVFFLSFFYLIFILIHILTFYTSILTLLTIYLPSSNVVRTSYTWRWRVPVKFTENSKIVQRSEYGYNQPIP